jgi:hypothetical protein
VSIPAVASVSVRAAVDSTAAVTGAQCCRINSDSSWMCH